MLTDSTDYLNSPSGLVRRNSKNAPVKAFNFPPRSSDSCFSENVNVRHRKRESPMFFIGNLSPAQNTELESSHVLLSPVEASQNIRRTCSVDALHNYKRFQKERYLKVSVLLIRHLRQLV